MLDRLLFQRPGLLFVKDPSITETDPVLFQDNGPVFLINFQAVPLPVRQQLFKSIFNTGVIYQENSWARLPPCIKTKSLFPIQKIFGLSMQRLIRTLIKAKFPSGLVFPHGKELKLRMLQTFPFSYVHYPVFCEVTSKCFGKVPFLKMAKNSFVNINQTISVY